MNQADLEAPPRTKLGVIAAVLLLHVLAILALIRAFAPDFTQKIVEQVVSTFTVTVTAPEPTPTPAARETSGAAAEVGKKAKPKPIIAAVPKIIVAKQIAPRAAASGTDNTSGASNSGAGTGAGGQGNGTGSGNGGSGQGSGATKAVKIAGDINSTRDYPGDSRDMRLGHEVVVYMTVGTDGRARNCHVQKPSPDPRADAITCTLAEQRFRFKPATDGAGNPVEATYGWRQRWFNPGGGQ